ncbi:casein kinase 1-like protein HD16 [Tanacetum coccineum]
MCKPILATYLFSTISCSLGAITLKQERVSAKFFIFAFRSGAVIGFLLAANGLLVLYITINMKFGEEPNYFKLIFCLFEGLIGSNFAIRPINTGGDQKIIFPVGRKRGILNLDGEGEGKPTKKIRMAILQDRVIARLQQPFPLEYIHVEAEYQSAASDYGTPAPSISDIHWTHNFQEPRGTRFQKGENQEGEDETDIDVDDTNGRRLSWHSDMDNGL